MKKVPLTQGKFSLVDDEDFEEVSKFNWCASKDIRGRFYAKRGSSREINIFLHRQILGLLRGDKKQVDHINGDSLDNRKSNLRLCTPSQNAANRKLGSNNKTGHTGVCWISSKKKWVAYLYIDGVRILNFATKNFKKAVEKRKEAENKFFGEFRPIKTS